MSALQSNRIAQKAENASNFQCIAAADGSNTLHLWEIKPIWQNCSEANVTKIDIPAIQKMIRRPLTEIELKLDDLQEYEALRREQTSSSMMASDSPPDNLHTPKPWDKLGPKSTEEIHSRIGYAPKKKPTTVVNSNSV